MPLMMSPGAVRHKSVALPLHPPHESDRVLRTVLELGVRGLDPVTVKAGLQRYVL
jgi:hypothetical protein